MCRGSSSLLLFTFIVVFISGNSSVGRAQPCQGWGRGSESRFPLDYFFIINQDRFKFRAQVAELVDAHVSGACVSQRAGSSPVLGTMFKLA